MTYDFTTAEANNTDNTRNDRWEVSAKSDDGQWWTVSDSAQMTQAEAEKLAAEMRAEA